MPAAVLQARGSTALRASVPRSLAGSSLLAASLQHTSTGRPCWRGPATFTSGMPAQRSRLPFVLRMPLVRTCAKNETDDVAGSSSAPQQQSDGRTGLAVGSVGLFLLWAALAVYAFVFAPNQTPLRDQYFLEKLVGIGSNDGVAINAVFTQLFFVMGVWPLVYTALLIPSAKSANGVPAWPFITLSYGIGAFGLIPFMALWQPPNPPPKVPADKEELEGVGNLMQKGMETPVPAVLALVGAISCIYQAATAGPAAWNEYFKLLEESRFVHVTTADFLTLTALAPFWMSNDAELRRWELRDKLLPVLSLIPVLGPAMYLCLRPRARL